MVAVTPTSGSQRRRRFRRLLTSLGIVALLCVLLGVALNLSLTARLERIEGAFDGLRTRPAPAAGETILMVGTRPDHNGDVPWLEGQQSVESAILIEIDAARTRVRVESLPLGDGIAASAPDSLPSTIIAAVEAWSGRRVDHLMAIDWRTFARLAAENGVGPDYVRGSPAHAQQDYLREILRGTLQQELRTQPLDLYRLLATTADGTALDDDWSIIELDLLALSLHDLRSRNITFDMARPQ